MLDEWPEYREDIAKLANLNLRQLERERLRYVQHSGVGTLTSDIYKVG